MPFLDTLKSFIYGPPPGAVRALSLPLEKRDYGYAGRYVLPNPIKLGTLVSGPGATQLYRDAFGSSDADNSAVAACLNAICRAYNEVPLRHWRDSGDDGAVEVAPSPLDALLHRPNPSMTLRQLRAYWQWCKQAHGNAYVWKLRAGDPNTGTPVELWPISPSKIAPVRYKGSTDFISAYRYYPENGTRYVDIPPANIIHFKQGLDDEDHMLGCSNLRKLAREIRTDRTATDFAERLLANKGTASLIVTFPADTTYTPEEAAQIKAAIKAEFSGENIGGVAVVAPGGDAKQMSFSPRDMDLGVLHDYPHALISAVIGIPASLAGLPIGLQYATYSNTHELREYFTESFLIPEWENDGDTLTTQLLSDFTDAVDESLGFDYSQARALQQDQDALYKRLSVAVGGPWLLADEARVIAGHKALSEAERAQLNPAPATPPAALGAGETRALRLLERKGLGEEAIAGLLLASREELTRETQAALETYFVGQRKRVTSRIG